MTVNQISYLNAMENQRANRAREFETNRSNLAHERETMRSNLERESELRRSNMAQERELHRSNTAREALSQGTLSETMRSNLAREAETQRSNKANERFRLQDLGIQMSKLPAELELLEAQTERTAADALLSAARKDIETAKSAYNIMAEFGSPYELYDYVRGEGLGPITAFNFTAGQGIRDAIKDYANFFGLIPQLLKTFV